MFDSRLLHGFVVYPRDRRAWTLLVLAGIMMIVAGQSVPKTLGKIDWK